ncbi:hypothetical protein AMELA_G00044880 [Ameiurus melas]|uniref:Uncharacterized protein n=1 Tax=Ameiurus melas TaxID=219545 RepID=A0A7J6B4U9_AMEME|nr:hypothetical protein AMELA_G00044880 [Ameiurus melas]
MKKKKKTPECRRREVLVELDKDTYSEAYKRLEGELNSEIAHSNLQSYSCRQGVSAENRGTCREFLRDRS